MTAATRTNPTPFEAVNHNIGAWALPYLVNGDQSDISGEEKAMVDSWLDWATGDWKDSDDNLWRHAHESIDTDSLNEFGMDEITGLHGPVYTVQIIFMKGN